MRIVKPTKFFWLCAFLSVAIAVTAIVFQRRPSVSRVDFEAPYREPRQENLSYAITACDSSQKRRLTLSSTVVVASELLSQPMNKKLAETLAQDQIRFLSGYFNYSEKGEERYFLSAKRPVIRKINWQDTRYEGDVKIRPQWDEAPVNSYQAKAFEKKEVKSGRPATSINYTAEVEVSSCGKSSPSEEVSLILPKDPHLSYWNIPEEAFVEKKFGALSTKVNPCAYAEMADIKNANWFWYLWQPGFEKCRELIKDSKSYVRLKATFSEPVPLTKIEDSFWDLPEELKVTVFYGTLKPEALEASVHLLQRGLSLEQMQEELRKDITKNDPALMAMVRTQARLPDFMEISSTEVKQLSEDSFSFVYKGKIGNRTLTLILFYGPTSVDYREVPVYLNVAKEALSESDMVLYLGHSGQGYNFSLDEMGKKAKLSHGEFASFVKKKEKQVFVLISCYAYYYFGEDIIRHRTASEGLKTLLVRSAGSNFNFPVVYGVLNFLKHGDLKRQAFATVLEPMTYGDPFVVEYYE